MDPYLESPRRWPQVHKRLMVAMADFLEPRLPPGYRVVVEERVCVGPPEDQVLLGEPDVAIGAATRRLAGGSRVLSASGALVVQVPMSVELREWFLEIHANVPQRLVTAIEILSPWNKSSPKGRAEYLSKREQVLGSEASLVEIDVLRRGWPMPLSLAPPPSDYRILVSRGWERPRALLFPFGVRDPIPVFPVPLQAGEHEIPLDLAPLLDHVYARARMEADIDYSGPPSPPLRPSDAAWARRLIYKVRPRPLASPSLRSARRRVRKAKPAKARGRSR